MSFDDIEARRVAHDQVHEERAMRLMYELRAMPSPQSAFQDAEICVERFEVVRVGRLFRLSGVGISR